MSYLTHVGSFNIDTTKTAGQTQAVTGVGFQPKIVLFWWGGSTGTGDTVAGGTIRAGFGAAVSSSSRFSVSLISLDAAATSDVYSNSYTTECIRIWSDATPTIDGQADFSSMDADGFTLTVDDQFANAYRISYLALGGTDLTNVYIGTRLQPVSAGNYNTTSVGFQPDVLLTAFASIGSFGIGMATGSSNQGVVMGLSLDGFAKSATSGYGYNGEVINITGTSNRDAFVAFLENGFTLNHLEGASGYPFAYICLKGGQYKVHELTTRTDGNDIAESDVGFQPVAVLFASANRAHSTQETPTNNARLSIGAATGASERACAAISDENNLADTETAYSNSDSLVYQQIVDDAQAGGMDLKSIDSNGFTCVMDDPDPSACWVTYLAIGAAGGAALTIYPQSGLSQAVAGNPGLKLAVAMQGAASRQAAGNTGLKQAIASQGAAGQQAAGCPSLTILAPTLHIYPQSGLSQAAAGNPGLKLVLAVSGAAGASAGANPGVRLTLAPSGAASQQAAGDIGLRLALAPSGAFSREAAGTTGLRLVLAVSGAYSRQAGGCPSLSLVAPGLAIHLTGASSQSASGSPRLYLRLQGQSVGSRAGTGATGLILAISPAGISVGQLIGELGLKQSMAPGGGLSQTLVAVTHLSQTLASIGGRPSLAATSQPRLGLSLSPGAVASQAASGNTHLVLRLAIQAAASWAAAGNPALYIVSVQFIYPPGAPSQMAAGWLSVFNIVHFEGAQAAVSVAVIVSAITVEKPSGTVTVEKPSGTVTVERWEATCRT